MNIQKLSGRIGLVRRIGLVGLVLTAALMAPNARGQAYTNVYGPNFYQSLTNFPVTLTNGQSLTIYGSVTSQRMVGSPTRGLAFGAQVHGTNNCTGNVSFACEQSIDGTTNTQTTTTPVTLLVPLSNTAKK